MSSQAKAGANVVARYARMTGSGYAIEMSVQAQYQSVRGGCVVLCDMVMNIGDVAFCGARDIQDFWRDLRAPNYFTSVRNVSAPVQVV